MMVTVTPLVIGALGTITTGTGRIGNKRTSRGHQNYRIIKIGSKIEKSPRNL